MPSAGKHETGVKAVLRKACNRCTKARENMKPAVRTWENMVVYHLPQIPGNSGWNVNGKRLFSSSHWKIPGTNGNSEKVVRFSRLGRSEWEFVLHLQVSRVSY